MGRLGFEYRWRAPERLLTVDDYRRAARRRLPKMVWYYVDEGADDLVTIRANRQAFGRYALWPAVLGAVAAPDLTTTVAGCTIDLPVLLAPTGFTGLSHWRGDLAAQRAAELENVRYVLSTASSYSIEEVAREVRGEPPWFQLYPRTGRVAQELMERAWAVGMRVLVVTVDTPTRGNREGERRRGMGIPPVLTPYRALDFATHPKWAYAALRYARIGGRNVTGGELRGVAGAVAEAQAQEREFMQSTLSWDDMAWIRQHWQGPVLVKGILRAEDARRAVDLGADGVVVSNHGGRQLDTAPATLDALVGIAEAVGSESEVLLDGGVRRGTDVVKALCLGARAVLIGRPYVYGLAVGAENGAAHVLRIFRDEMTRAMILLGAASVKQLGPSWVRPARQGEEGGEGRG
jgi:isopentenyl diphosphate isomerase/L-lactate dehydrogenase-like FMN-dependent dehydrogenase